MGLEFFNIYNGLNHHNGIGINGANCSAALQAEKLEMRAFREQPLHAFQRSVQRMLSSTLAGRFDTTWECGKIDTKMLMHALHLVGSLRDNRNDPFFVDNV